MIVDRFDRDVNPDDLDWFERERFEATMEDSRRVFRRLEEFRLQAAYDSEPVSVKCTAEERSAALHLAHEMFARRLSAENAVERLCSEGFPQDVSGGSTSGE